ncbi:uncharacterized protein JN550_005188 [Neoarthrinium moseri]|uniref:uncharacterized protein n=1 Tax=Neoarthrinium moseri TaxID=1658444 RepID=UPI001FDC3BCD|nr:uncharacterized protein JN550_005188 [Neoarthrinium moseri]KAI1870645.1 hypothetical protein JN550_005188 [Neoarthrinium moseri]
MVAFALGLGNYTAKQLEDTDILVAAFSAAHKALFSIAISKLVINSTDYQTGISTFNVSGILCRKAHFKLSRDPDSLGKMILIFKEHETVLRQFSLLDQLSADGLRESIGCKRYRLSDCGDAIEFVSDEEKGEPVHPKLGVLQHTAQDPQPKPLRLTELRLGTGVLIVTALAAGMAILIYLKSQEVSLGGLPRPSEKFEVLQILENYIPTIYATSLAPFWALLTLDIFAVALGGIFNESTVQVQYPVLFSQERQLLPVRETLIPDRRGAYVSTGYGDHFEVLFNNLSIHTDPPSWTTPVAYFLPFSENTSVHGSTDELRATTKGISAEPNCAALSTSPTSNPGVDVVVNATTQRLSLTYELPDGPKICGLAGDLVLGNLAGLKAMERQAGNSTLHIGLEVFKMLSGAFSQPNSSPSETFCSQKLIAAWIRVNVTGSGNTQSPVASTLIHCQPTILTALYDVTVNSRGQVTHYRRMGDFEELMLSPNNRTLSLRDEVMSSFQTGYTGTFHNTTFNTNWMSAFLSYVLNSTSHIDPLEAVPAADVMLPALESVYRQLGAVMFGLNPSFWNSTPDGTALVQGHVVRKEIRIFMSREAVWVSVAILGTYIVVALFVYVKGLGVTFPRMPSTIGSVLTYVAASQAVREYENPTAGYQKSGRVRTYTFGTFIGCDGKPHVGIEADPFVLPLKKEPRRLAFSQKNQYDHPAWI